MRTLLAPCMKFSRVLAKVHPLNRRHYISASRKGLLFGRSSAAYTADLTRSLSSDSDSDSEKDNDFVVKCCWGHIQIPDDTTYYQLLLDRFSQKPHKTAMINGLTGEKYSYSRLSDHVVRLANSLTEHGVGKGKVVSICSPNSIEVALLMLATNLTGAATNPISSQLTTGEMDKLLRMTSPDYMITRADIVDKVKSSEQKFKQIFTTDKADGCMSFSDLLSQGKLIDEPDTAISSRDTAYINFSSGTTGLPKAVVLSHYNILSQMLSLGHPGCSATKEEDVTIIIFPFAHIGGINILLNALYNISTMVIFPGFDMKQYLTAIQDHKVTQITIPPPINVRLFNDPSVGKYDLSSLNAITCGAAPIRSAQQEAVMERLNVEFFTQAYGTTESSGVTHIDDREDMCVGSGGKVIPNMQCKIVDQETGENVAPTSVGEICLKGPVVMVGYLNSPAETKRNITHGGWLKTGDIGYHNERGHLFIIDRSKELIKYKGLQVSPAELEAILLNHPDINDAAVIGVPDEIAGEVPKALVVLKPGRDSSKAMEENIHKFVNDEVAHFKRLRGGIAFIDSIPKLASGKILKRILREMEHKS